MRRNIFRLLRYVVSCLCLMLLVATFSDWGADLVEVDGLRWVGVVLARLQFVPALLSVSMGVVVGILVLTLFFGRIYCSTLCPLGVAQDGVNLLRKSRDKRAAMRFSFHRPNIWLRYGVLVAAVIFVAAGVGVGVALVDPYSIFGRIIYEGFRPAVQGLNNFVALLAPESFGREPITVSWLSFVVALVMMAIIGLLAWLYGRRYCTAWCPVGTLLGEVSRFALLKVNIDTSRCSSCGVCGRKCKAEAIDTANHRVDASRCVVCFDCLDDCAQGAISFGVGSASTQQKTSNLTNSEGEKRGGVSRKAFLSTMAAFVSVPVMQAQRRGEEAEEAMKQSTEGRAGGNHGEQGGHGAHGGGSNGHGGHGGGRGKGGLRPIAPPGAEGLENLHAKCTACNLCISKCPTHVLQPAVWEYGLQGIMQPTLKFNKGYCKYDCHLCGEVCPTGAIKLLGREEKKMTRLGHAIFRKDHCVITTDGRECGNCAKHCPAEAIKMVRSAVDRKRYPQIEKALCIGCGKCEYLCPASPEKAMVVKGFNQHK